MAVDMLQGASNTRDINQERLIIDMSKTIKYLDEDNAPFTILLNKLEMLKTTQIKFNWQEQRAEPYKFFINNGAGYSAGATILAVDDGLGNAVQYSLVSDILKVMRTMEAMYVSAVASGSVTVQRGFGETAAAAILDDDEVWIIGPAVPEGSSVRPMISRKTDTEYNFAQKFTQTVDITDESDEANTYGPKERSKKRKEKGDRQLRNIELAFLFGERYYDSTINTHTTRGVVKSIVTNILDVDGATLTWLQFCDNFAKPVFEHTSSSKEKLLLCSPLMISAISKWFENKVLKSQKEKTYGITMTDIVTPYGTFKCVDDRILRGDVLGSWAIAIDMAHARKRPYIKGTFKTNVHPRNYHGVQDEYYEMCGLEIKLEETHGYLYDLAGGA